MCEDEKIKEGFRRNLLILIYIQTGTRAHTKVTLQKPSLYRDTRQKILNNIYEF